MPTSPTPPASLRASRASAPLVAALAALTTACASFAPPSPRVTDARLSLVPVLAARTAFESEEAGRGGDRDDAPRARREPSEAVFWAGVIIASIGGAGALGMGTAARITERQVVAGFEGDGLSRERLDTLNDRGKALNRATIVSGAIGLAGALMAATAYGIEWTKCGKLAPERRRCAAR